MKNQGFHFVNKCADPLVAVERQVGVALGQKMLDVWVVSLEITDGICDFGSAFGEPVLLLGAHRSLP
ncbi:hypothetical protein D3C85_1787660 [compost metagenome]